MEHKVWNGRFIEAMNASTIKPDDPKRQQKIEKLINDPNVVFQRKLNGERLITFKHCANPDNDSEPIRYNTFATGRNFSKYGSPMMKTGLVPHILADLREATTGDTVLDGEVLFIPNQAELSLDQIKAMEFTEDFWACRDIMAHHVNPTGGVEQQQQDGFLHYFVFDLLVYKGIECVSYPYGERLRLLEEFATEEFKQSRFIHIMTVARTPEEKRALLEHCLAIGLEGVVAKHVGKHYQEGKRPANVWVKIKKFDPSDGIIIGYNAAEQYTEIISNGKKIVGPDGKVLKAVSRFYLNNWVGAVWLGQWSANPPTEGQQKAVKQIGLGRGPVLQTREEDGKTYWLVPVAKVSGMSDAMRAKISRDQEGYLGKIVAFKYFEKTADAYFHPSFMYFRDDKPEYDCIWE